MFLTSFTILTKVKIFTNRAFISNSDNRIHSTSITDIIMMNFFFFLNLRLLNLAFFHTILVLFNLLSNLRNHIFNLFFQKFSHFFFFMFHLHFLSHAFILHSLFKLSMRWMHWWWWWVIIITRERHLRILLWHKLMLTHSHWVWLTMINY